MNVSIVGSGNVATHISRAISRVHTVVAVCSRNIMHAKQIADDIGTIAMSDVKTLPKSDICVMAITDDAISNVAQDVPQHCGIVVHTSGATSIEVLASHQYCGVLYPCQTFSSEAKLEFRNVPLFVEGSDDATLDILIKFAKSLSDMVTKADSKQRAYLHVAAVLASNFTNRLLCLASEFMQSHDMPFEMLRPLVEQTVSKAFLISPYEAQTGPARRNDVQTIERHLQLIDNEQLLSIYKMLSNNIINAYKRNSK